MSPNRLGGDDCRLGRAGAKLCVQYLPNICLACDQASETIESRQSSRDVRVTEARSLHRVFSVRDEDYVLCGQYERQERFGTAGPGRFMRRLSLADEQSSLRLTSPEIQYGLQ